MNLTHNSPFRILGVPVTANIKDITRQVHILATYAGLGKARFLETDFLFLPPVNRTGETIEEANKRIEQSENKFFYSLFWFWKNNSVDELAWDALKEGRIENAIEIWERAIFANKEELCESDRAYGAGIKVSSTNFSNIKNLSVLFLSLTAESSGTLAQGYLRRGAALASKCFSAKCIEEYAKLVAGERFVYDSEKALHFYISNVVDSLKQYFPATHLVEVFWAFPPGAKKYITTRFLATRIQRVEKEIESAFTARRGSASSAVDVGKSLIENTRSDIEFLKDSLGKTDYQYQTVADKLVEEIVNCGIAFFNETHNDEPCLHLYEYGSVVAGSHRVRKRAKENLESCLQWIAHNSIRQKSNEERSLESVESRINVVLASRASAKAKYRLLRNQVIPQLDSLKLERGQNSEIFARASNSLARVFKNLARELDQRKDFNLAHEAIELALTICCDEKLCVTIKSERALINQDIYVIPVRDLCDRATAMATDHPEGADQIARWLVNNSRPLLSDLKEVVSSDSVLAESYDEVVLAALTCHNLYGKATGNVEGCLQIAEILLPLAVGQIVRSKVAEQIDFAHWYLTQGNSSKTEQPLANEQDTSQRGEATRSGKDHARTESVYESDLSEQAIHYTVRYSESDQVKALTGEIASMLNASELAQQKFFWLVDHIVPRLKEINLLCGENSTESRAVSERAANALREVSSELLWEASAQGLAFEALRLAADISSDPKLRMDVERDQVGLADYAGEIRLLTESLDRVPVPPTLRSLAGTGLVLAGTSGYDTKRISHVTNLYFSLLFLRLLPLARYRIIDRGDGRVTFVGRANLRRIDHIHIVLTILFVVGLAIGLFVALLWSA
jgi:hypothetical protein